MDYCFRTPVLWVVFVRMTSNPGENPSILKKFVKYKGNREMDDLSKNKIPRSSVCGAKGDGRASGTRTRGLMHPMHARYQLRHSPIVRDECSHDPLFLQEAADSKRKGRPMRVQGRPKTVIRYGTITLPSFWRLTYRRMPLGLCFGCVRRPDAPDRFALLCADCLGGVARKREVRQLPPSSLNVGHERSE
jgi:hypothetical protein